MNFFKSKKENKMSNSLDENNGKNINSAILLPRTMSNDTFVTRKSNNSINQSKSVKNSLTCCSALVDFRNDQSNLVYCFKDLKENNTKDKETMQQENENDKKKKQNLEKKEVTDNENVSKDNNCLSESNLFTNDNNLESRELNDIKNDIIGLYSHDKNFNEKEKREKTDREVNDNEKELSIKQKYNVENKLEFKELNAKHSQREVIEHYNASVDFEFKELNAKQSQREVIEHHNASDDFEFKELNAKQSQREVIEHHNASDDFKQAEHKIKEQANNASDRKEFSYIQSERDYRKQASGKHNDAKSNERQNHTLDNKSDNLIEKYKVCSIINRFEAQRDTKSVNKLLINNQNDIEEEESWFIGGASKSKNLKQTNDLIDKVENLNSDSIVYKQDNMYGSTDFNYTSDTIGYKQDNMYGSTDFGPTNGYNEKGANLDDLVMLDNNISMFGNTDINIAGDPTLLDSRTNILGNTIAANEKIVISLNNTDIDNNTEEVILDRFEETALANNSKSLLGDTVTGSNTGEILLNKFQEAVLLKNNTNLLRDSVAGSTFDGVSFNKLGEATLLNSNNFLGDTYVNDKQVAVSHINSDYTGKTLISLDSSSNEYLLGDTIFKKVDLCCSDIYSQRDSENNTNSTSSSSQSKEYSIEHHLNTELFYESLKKPDNLTKQGNITIQESDVLKYLFSKVNISFEMVKNLIDSLMQEIRITDKHDDVMCLCEGEYSLENISDVFKIYGVLCFCMKNHIMKFKFNMKIYIESLILEIHLLQILKKENLTVKRILEGENIEDYIHIDRDLNVLKEYKEIYNDNKIHIHREQEIESLSYKYFKLYSRSYDDLDPTMDPLLFLLFERRESERFFNVFKFATKTDFGYRAAVLFSLKDICYKNTEETFKNYENSRAFYEGILSIFPDEEIDENSHILPEYKKIEYENFYKNILFHNKNQNANFKIKEINGKDINLGEKNEKIIFDENKFIDIQNNEKPIIIVERNNFIVHNKTINNTISQYKLEEEMVNNKKNKDKVHNYAERFMEKFNLDEKVAKSFEIYAAYIHWVLKVHIDKEIWYKTEKIKEQWDSNLFQWAFNRAGNGCKLDAIMIDECSKFKRFEDGWKIYKFLMQKNKGCSLKAAMLCIRAILYTKSKKWTNRLCNLFIHITSSGVKDDSCYITFEILSRIVDSDEEEIRSRVLKVIVETLEQFKFLEDDEIINCLLQGFNKICSTHKNTSDCLICHEATIKVYKKWKEKNTGFSLFRKKSKYSQNIYGYVLGICSECNNCCMFENTCQDILDSKIDPKGQILYSLENYHKKCDCPKYRGIHYSKKKENVKELLLHCKSNFSN